MAIYRNWKQICKIADLNLRLALALIREDALLEGLRRGFPNCFSDRPTNQPLIPASVIRQLAFEESVEEESSYVQYHEYDRELSWYNVAMGRFNIPGGPWWTADRNEVPPEVRKQLVGQALRFGMQVVWQSEEYLVAELVIPSMSSKNSDLGHVLTEKDVQEELGLALIPARFIDLNS